MRNIVCFWRLAGCGVAAGLLAGAAFAVESAANLGGDSASALTVEEIPAAGISEAQTPQMIWDRFTAALRSGQMAQAYRCLSPASRQEMTYRDFCAAWHPLTMRSESVLCPPGFSEFRLSGDLAMLRLGVRETPGIAGAVSEATLVREDGRWWVLDGANAERTAAEAMARNVLARLVKQSKTVQNALHSGGPVLMEDLQRELPRFFEERHVSAFFRNYSVDIDALRDGVVIARPRKEGWRAFSAGLNGEIEVYTATPPVRLTGDQVRQQEEARVRKLLQDAARATVPSSPAAAPERTLAAVNSASAKTAAAMPDIPPEFGDPDKFRAKTASAAATGQKEPGKAAPLEEDFALPEMDEGEAPHPVVPQRKAPAAPAASSTKTIAPGRGTPLTQPAGKVVTSGTLSRDNKWAKEVIELNPAEIAASD